jgi:hypothetical protein
MLRGAGMAKKSGQARDLQKFFQCDPELGDVIESLRIPEVMLEIPRTFVEDWKREKPSPVNSDEAIAADIARVVAVRTAFPYKNFSKHECGAPNWYQRSEPWKKKRNQGGSTDLS